jgi:hypothetical protein
MGGGEAERKEGQLGPGAASQVEEEVAKTSSDSPTKKVEGRTWKGFRKGRRRF